MRQRCGLGLFFPQGFGDNAVRAFHLFGQGIGDSGIGKTPAAVKPGLCFGEKIGIEARAVELELLADALDSGAVLVRDGQPGRK